MMQLLDERIQEYQTVLGMAVSQSNAIDHPQITTTERERLRYGLKSLEKRLSELQIEIEQHGGSVRRIPTNGA